MPTLFTTMAYQPIGCKTIGIPSANPFASSRSNFICMRTATRSASSRRSLKYWLVLTSSYLADQPSKWMCIFWFCKSWSVTLATHQLLTESFASINTSNKSRVFWVLFAYWLISCYSLTRPCPPASPIWRSLFMTSPVGGAPTTALPAMPWPAAPDGPPCAFELFWDWLILPSGTIEGEPPFAVSGFAVFAAAPSLWLKILCCCWLGNWGYYLASFWPVCSTLSRCSDAD